MMNVSAGTVEADTSVSVTVAGFAAKQEVALDRRPGSRSPGKVTANAQGGVPLPPPHRLLPLSPRTRPLAVATWQPLAPGQHQGPSWR